MSELIPINQAWGLQQLFSPVLERGIPSAASTPAAGSTLSPPRRRTRALTVAAGKGGVGKTTVAVNLSMALAMAGREVILLDADMSLANVDVLLGLSPARHIGHLLDGDCALQELIMAGPHGLKVVPAGSGSRRLGQLGNAEHAAVIRAFDELCLPPEYLVIDTAAGVSDNVAMFAAAADDVVLVVCDEPASLTDAYALMKVLSREFGVRRFRMVANMARHAGEARQLHDKLARVCDRFLDVVLEFSGVIPYDERLRQAIRRQGAVVDLWPASRSAMGFKQLAGLVDTWGEPERREQGRIAFLAVKPARRRFGE